MTIRSTVDAPLATARTVLFDLDGCIWFGDELAAGAAELVRDVRASGRDVGFLTNISSGRSTTIAAKLTRLGIPTEASAVLMPIEAIEEHPALRDRPPTFVVAQPEVRAAIGAVTPLTDDPDGAELVVVARDPDLTYQRLADALQPLLRGAPLLALNLDVRVPVEHGRVLPGNGAIVAALEAAAGIRADVVGKPSRFFFEVALRRFGASAERSVMVGDTLDSDIAGGVAAGIPTVQVGHERATLLTPPPRPDHAVDDVRGLRALLGL